MPFLKIDTSGMNNRYGRSTAKPSRSFQVTEFNSPTKNRAPYIPKTEAKEGDVLSFFDDGKGKVLTSFDGGYQSAQTSKVSDMSRIDLGMTALDFKTVKSAKVEFKGVLNAPIIATKIITIESGPKAQYIPSAYNTTLYLDGTYGGEIGSFVRAEVLCAIDGISMGDLGVDVGTTVTLESGGNPYWRLRFNHFAGDNKLAMATDEIYYPMLESGEYLNLYDNHRAILVRGPSDWRLLSVTGVNGSSVNTGMQMTTFLPLADDSYDIGSSTKQWKNGYFDGTLEADAITVGGTALNTVIAGVTVSNATTAAVGTTVTITDNESTNENNAIIFTSGGDVDGGNIGLESDGDLTYNPSTGTLTTTKIGAFEAAGAIDFSDENMTNVDIDSGYIDGVYLGSNAVCPEVTCTALNVNGTATIGDNLADTIVINSRLQLGGSSLRPVSTDNYDIGDPHETGTEARLFWRSLYMRGSINMMNIQSVPSTTETDCIALYATDVSSSSELKVVDEAENVTTLSPHNFSVCGGPSEDMAWAYYSENKGKKINVDMLKLARLVEDLSGEKLVYTEEEKNET
jgi:hypothetical protein